LTGSGRSARHSFNGIADRPGELLHLGDIDPDIVIGRERMILTVGAGASYAVLAAALQREGFALHNLASLPHISIAGAVTTATHGSGDQNQALASAVAGFELVMGDGGLHRVTRGDADFAGMVVSLGALGILSRITLDIGPSFNVRQDAFVDLPWEVLLDSFDAIFSAAYSVSILTKCAGPNVNRIWLKTRMDGSTRPQTDVVRLGLKPGPPYSLPPKSENPLADLNPFGVPGPWSERLAHMPQLNANRALTLAQRAYVPELGKVVLNDTGDALMNNDQVRQSYLGG
jgi:xylitol oxidase